MLDKNKGHIHALPVFSYESTQLPKAAKDSEELLHEAGFSTEDVIEIVNYNTKLAVSIPLFYSHIDSGQTQKSYERLRNVHAKGAIWAAATFAHFTDLGSCPILFHIDERVYDIVKPTFDAFEVPTDDIRIIRHLPYTEEVSSPAFGKKFMCLLDTFQPTSHWLICDSDLFLHSPDRERLEVLDILTNTTDIMGMETYNDDFYTEGADLQRFVTGEIYGIGREPGHFYEVRTVDGIHNNEEQERECYLEVGLQYPTFDGGRRPFLTTQQLLLPTKHPVIPFLKEHGIRSHHDEFLMSMYLKSHELPFRSLKTDVYQCPYYNLERQFIARDKTYRGPSLAHIHPDDFFGQESGGLQKLDEFIDDFYEGLRFSDTLPERIREGTHSLVKREGDDAKSYDLKAAPPAIIAPIRVEETFAHTASDKVIKFGRFYNMLLNLLMLERQRPLRICEIGVSMLHNGSLIGFQNIEQVGEFVGIDIKPTDCDLMEKTTFYQRDGYTEETIELLQENHEPFDLIIDDGSHRAEDQAFFLEQFDRLLAPGGYIVCEDIVDQDFYHAKTAEDCEGHEATSAHQFGRLLVKQKDAEKIEVAKHFREFVEGPPVYQKTRKHKQRFHVLGIPYSVTSKAFAICQFTQNVLNFCNGMTDLGHIVIHYGHDRSENRATENVNVMDNDVFSRVYGDDTNWAWENMPRFTTDDGVAVHFNRETIAELRKRLEPGDFVLAFYGHGHKAVCDGIKDIDGIHIVEPAICYPDAFTSHRVYSSPSKRHFERGRQAVAKAFPLGVQRDFEVAYDENTPLYSNTDIPLFFDEADYEPRMEKSNYLLYLGRVDRCKGVHLAIDAVKHKGQQLIIAGPGDVNALGVEIPSHVEHVGVADLDFRKELMAGAKACLFPSLYLEPAMATQFQAWISATPVITPDYGGPRDFNLNGKTGYRFSSLNQLVWALRSIENIAPADCYDYGRNFTIKPTMLRYHEYFVNLRWMIENGFDAISEDAPDSEDQSITLPYDEARVIERYEAVQEKIANG